MADERKLLGSSAAVRRHIVDALSADLVGPFIPDDGATPEVWDIAPSKRYLYGFLVPRAQAAVEDEQDKDPDDDELAEAGSDPAEGSQNDPQVKRPPLLPSSIGLSVLLRDGEDDVVSVRVTYADYVAEPQEPAVDGDGKKKRGRPPVLWRRMPGPPIECDVALTRDILQPLGDSGLTLYGTLDVPGDIDGLPPGTRALALFVVNEREAIADKIKRDQAYAFQVGLEVRHAQGLEERPDLAGQAATDWDDQVMDLQFREQHSYATGHGVAVDVITQDGRVVGARTDWLPEAKVKRVTTREIAGVEVRMEELAELGSAAAVHAALDGIPAAYAAWLREERGRIPALDDRHRATAGQVLLDADRALQRIRDGIELLAENAGARRAFCTANRAMAMAARQRSPERYVASVPRWRMFQLAFVLLSLRAIVDPTHADRDIVELIFFPTGGGKTEAYLGVIAFTLVWRRMTHGKSPDRGLGVAVMLRYTLRLLTLDQLGRAATLICALELLRANQLELGDVRFSLGLWVGKSATANKLTEVARQITDYRNGSTNLSPFPLSHCPWCRKPLVASCLKVVPNQKDPVEVEVGCADFTCEFSARRGGLPVVFVDEQIYRELPSFLIATVDKFAMLSWRGESGALFGQVSHRIGRQFVGPCTPAPSGLKDRPEKLPSGLLPPELIVQDELHLISGPLGTMVGLYETAIEHLACRRTAGEQPVKPKLIASTATVKRAMQQIQALYGRDDMAMFPPPGIDDSESFFAQVDTQANGRLYLGVAAAGRSAKAVLVSVYAALLSAAAKCTDPEAAPGQPADPYLTLVGYFNNLRELGGMRRLVEDLIRARAASRGDLRPVGAIANPWLANREIKEPIELTSRENTSAISRARSLLEACHGEDGFVDTVLASNMISVGVDIERLGLMVVAGQPKSTSEYIQASSRVGRNDTQPGLVVTCYNLNKPRDRSYYEHFRDYHACFYRHVEATSVTPFSSPALERGLAGCLVAMVRHGVGEMAPPEAAMELDAHVGAVQAAIQALIARGRAQPGLDDGGDAAEAELRVLAERVLDRWSTFIAEAKAGGAQRCYSPYDVRRPGTPVLWTALDESRARDRGMTTLDHFVAPTSMRDVESTVHLWLKPAGWSTGGRS
jgi:hypothetical protein